METEVRQVQEGSEWMPTVAWRFCPGDCVFICDEKNGARLGRLDCVRLNWCPDQEQTKDPGHNHLWPIYLFGQEKSRREWIHDSHIKGVINSTERLKKYLEESAITLNGNDSDNLLQKAIDDFKSDPLKEWQFPLSSKEMKIPEKLEHNLKQFEQWFYDENDAMSLSNDWIDEGLAKPIIDLNKHNSSMVFAQNDTDDIIQEFYERSMIKIRQVEVNDIVGCVYNAYYVARVIEKQTYQIKVQFYKKTLPKKNEKNSKSSNTEVTYKEKRGDTDFITTKRQGYLYFHLKMNDLKHARQPNGDQLMTMQNGKSFHEYNESQKLLWNNHKISLQLKSEPIDN